MKYELFNSICHIDSFKGTKKKLPKELDGKVSKAFCVINYPFKKKKRIDYASSDQTVILLSANTKATRGFLSA